MTTSLLPPGLAGRRDFPRRPAGSVPVVTPTAIDAIVLIESVRVIGRHRKHMGDIRALANSIRDLGLINPITLTRDGRLVAGERRLAACRSLGHSDIAARFVDNLDDAAKLLRAERDENTCREDMKPSEKASLGAALEEIERPAALARKAEAGRSSAPGRPAEKHPGAHPEVSGETRDLVGEALGMHGRTYEDLRFAHNLAHDESAHPEDRQLAAAALADMDARNAILGPARKLRRDLRAKQNARLADEETISRALAEAREVMEPQAKPSREDSWIPTAADKGPQPAAQRRRLIAQWAERGLSSSQMAAELGIGATTIRRIAREQEIRIPADEAIGRSKQTVDSNRIVRETVNTLEGTLFAVGLVNFDALDLGEVPAWTASLSESIRVLNRLNKTLKELANACS